MSVFCRKYAEVTYKCKPAAFKSRVACGGDIFSLSCQPGTDQRLAILSAVFASAATGIKSAVFASAATGIKTRCHAVPFFCYVKNKEYCLAILSATFRRLHRSCNRYKDAMPPYSSVTSTGQCQEMNTFFRGLKNQVSSYLISGWLPVCRN